MIYGTSNVCLQIHLLLFSYFAYIDICYMSPILDLIIYYSFINLGSELCALMANRFVIHHLICILLLCTYIYSPAIGTSMHLERILSYLIPSSLILFTLWLFFIPIQPNEVQPGLWFVTLFPLSVICHLSCLIKEIQLSTIYCLQSDHLLTLAVC